MTSKGWIELDGVPAPFGDSGAIHRLFNLQFDSKFKIVFLVTNNSFVTNNPDGKRISRGRMICMELYLKGFHITLLAW